MGGYCPRSGNQSKMDKKSKDRELVKPASNSRVRASDAFAGAWFYYIKTYACNPKSRRATR